MRRLHGPTSLIRLTVSCRLRQWFDKGQKGLSACQKIVGSRFRGVGSRLRLVGRVDFTLSLSNASLTGLPERVGGVTGGAGGGVSAIAQAADGIIHVSPEPSIAGIRGLTQPIYES